MTIHLRKGKAGFWFTLVASNGRILVTSETYTRRAGAVGAIRTIVQGCQEMPIIVASSKAPRIIDWPAMLRRRAMFDRLAKKRR